MKKFIPALSLATYLSFASPAFALTVNACPTGISGFANLCSLGFGSIVQTLLTTLFILAIVVALFYLVWGGFKWITSGGDKAAVQQAREHVIAAIIGLVVVFLAYFILKIVLNFFGLGTGLSWDLPIVP